MKPRVAIATADWPVARHATPLRPASPSDRPALHAFYRFPACPFTIMSRHGAMSFLEQMKDEAYPPQPSQPLGESSPPQSYPLVLSLALACFV